MYLLFTDIVVIVTHPTQQNPSVARALSLSISVCDARIFCVVVNTSVRTVIMRLRI